MIRINLLPQRKARKQELGQRQLVYMGFSLLVVTVLAVFVQIHTQGEYEAILRQNQGIQAEIDRFKSEIGDYDQIRAQREELLRQQQTIEKLNQARTGPVFLLRELAEILTPAKGPTFDKVEYAETLRRDPNAGFNAAWDTRRVWLLSYEEKEHAVHITGAAKSNEDVAEFLKRLQASVFFKDVVLDSTTQAGGNGSGQAVKYMTFNLNTQVVY